MKTFPASLIVAACLLGASLRAQNAATPAAPDATIQLQFPNNGISDVLGIYELLTGKSVVKE